MSRKRIIDTELYFDTDLYDILGDRGLHLYIRLWGIAEDSGVYIPNYSDIALQLGALKFSNEEVKNLIKSLIKAKKILVFHENKREFHWLRNFLKHQTLNNPPPPKLPLPKWLKCVHHKFKSGKEYVKYSIIQSELLVIRKATAGITSTLPVPMKRNETKRIETKQNRNRIETETLSPLSPQKASTPIGSEGDNGSETEKEILFKRFNIFKEAYPKWSKGPVVEQLFFELHPDEQLFSRIISGLETLKKCDEWKRESGRFIPSPDNFLRDRRWEDKLPQPTLKIQPVHVSAQKNLSSEDIQKFDQARSEGLKKIKEVLRLPITDTS